MSTNNKKAQSKHHSFTCERVVTEDMLLDLTRDQLRALAAAHHVSRGRDRRATLRNLVVANLTARITVTLPA